MRGVLWNDKSCLLYGTGCNAVRHSASDGCLELCHLRHTMKIPVRYRNLKPRVTGCLSGCQSRNNPMYVRFEDGKGASGNLTPYAGGAQDLADNRTPYDSQCHLWWSGYYARYGLSPIIVLHQKPFLRKGNRDGNGYGYRHP